MSEFPANPHPTVEEGLSTLLEDVKQGIRRRHEACERRIAAAPTQSVLAAVAAGYLLHRLPVRPLVVANVRLASALVVPALFAFGAAKVCECLQKQARRRS